LNAPDPSEPSNPIVAEVVRSGFVESRHHGVLVALGPGNTGNPVAAGATDAPIMPRSALKPLQAAAMLRAGLDLSDELLALAAASHMGEDFHADGVRKILGAAGLSEADLRCPPAWPLHRPTARALTAAGGERAAIRMPCSGKHAAMLATCVANGWPTATYTDPEHPLQQAIHATIEELCGEPIAATAVDGCGASTFAVSPSGLARGYQRLVLAPAGSAERTAIDAMRAFPEWTSGTGHDADRLMRAVPGLVAKNGAEGVYAAALANGGAVTVKIDDGAMRAAMPLTVALLRALDVTAIAGVDHTALDALARVPVHGGLGVVGEVRTVL
jgi:L-asparaginase II